MVLRDDTTGIYVWSESFRLGLGNWFETQQRIIRRIATALNVQLSTERLMRLAGEPDVSLDLHDRWLRGQSLHSSTMRKAGSGQSTIFRDAIQENPGFSPCYSSLVQMNNIEHFVHPGVFRDLEKGQGDARTGEDRRSTGSGRFQGASMLWLVLRDGAPRGGGGAAYGTGVRAQRQ